MRASKMLHDDKMRKSDEGSDNDEEYLEEEEFRAPARRGKKIGRNAPCPCGSGKKYKKCCLKKEGV
jgi:uncharacterized protein YchJ